MKLYHSKTFLTDSESGDYGAFCIVSFVRWTDWIFALGELVSLTVATIKIAVDLDNQKQTFCFEVCVKNRSDEA